MGSEITTKDVGFLRRQARLSRVEGAVYIASRLYGIAEKLASAIETGGVKEQSNSMLDKWRMPIELRVDGHYRLPTVPLREVLQAIFADPEMRKLIGTAIAEAPIPIYQATPGSAYALGPTRKEQNGGKE